MDSRQLFLVPPPPEFNKVFHKHQQTTSQIMQQQQQPQCNICGTTEKLLRCAKCKAIYYCSTDHQHFDWPTHKQQCRALAKKRQINNNLQQLTNGCGAININGHSNALNSTANGTPTWSYRCTDSCYDNINEPNVKHNSFVLGTNENEILNSKAETVTQNSDRSGYMGSFDANSTTSDQMHHIMVQNGLNLPYMHGVSKKSYNDNSLSYYPSIQTQFREDIIKHSTNPQQTDHENVADVLNQRNCIETKLLQQQHQLFLQQQTDTQYPVPQLSNHLTNQHEKSSSYQIGAAVIGENFLENANERRYEELCRNIINDMNHYGLSVIDDFIGREKGLQILNEVDKMYSAGVFKDGQLVNNLKSEQDLRTIRGDKITWVKGVESGCSNVGYLINQIDAVICRSNSMINNGKLGNYVIKERTKAMVACYPGSGSHYVMHVDNPNKDGRVITAIYYLNLNWDSKNSGGVLRIFPEQTKSVADIEPKFDRLIFFWSDKRNPHEVQPAHRTRYAITVWYFDANEREQALNRCKNAPHSINSYKNNIGCVSQTDQNNATKNTTSKASTAVNSNSASFSASPACTSILQRTSLPNKQTLAKDSFKNPAAIPNTTQNSNRPIQVVRPNSHK